jgi:hypothetical protein
LAVWKAAQKADWRAARTAVMKAAWRVALMGWTTADCWDVQMAAWSGTTTAA